MNSEMSENVYNRLNYIAALCAIFVVYIHSDNTTQYELNGKIGDIAKFIEGIIAPSIINVAVPLFFLISGILYFRNYNWNKVLSKYKSRINSIVIPYFAWNIIYTIVAVFFTVSIIGKYMGDAWKMDSVSLEEIINGILFHKYLPMFWFLVYLMLYIAISPAIYLLIKDKKIGLFFIVLYLVLLAFGVRYASDDLFLYLLGGYVAIHHKELLNRDSYSSREYITAIILLVLVITTRVVFNIRDIDEPSIIETIFCIIYFVSLYIIFSYLPEFNTIKTVGKYQFFIYATHLFILSLFKKTVRIVFPNNSVLALIAYLCAPIFTIITACFIGNLMSKKVPKLYKILVGGR